MEMCDNLYIVVILGCLSQFNRHAKLVVLQYLCVTFSKLSKFASKQGVNLIFFCPISKQKRKLS